MCFKTVLNLRNQQGFVLPPCLFAETLIFNTKYQPQSPGLLFKIKVLDWRANKAQADGHGDDLSFPPALGPASSCQGLEKKAEEAVERAVPGRELTTAVETDQPQQVCVPKKPHLILRSRNNTAQHVTWANEVELSLYSKVSGEEKYLLIVPSELALLYAKNWIFIWMKKGEKGWNKIVLKILQNPCN